MAEVAAWLTVTAVSDPAGHPARGAIRARVLAFLQGWRDKFGQAKLDEVKQQLQRQLQKNGKTAELQERIDGLFSQLDAS